LDRVLGTLAEIGFDAEWHCIPAAAVGAPHIRDRVFVLANAGHGGIDQRTWGPRSEQKPKTSVSQEFSRDGENRHVAYSGCERQGAAEELDRKATVRCKGRINIADSSWWQIEPDVGRVANGVPSRAHRLRGLGNAVVPQVAEVVARRVLELAK
jgi:DNA (cytosine-5)-methyltransferase 1